SSSRAAKRACHSRACRPPASASSDARSSAVRSRSGSTSSSPPARPRNILATPPRTPSHASVPAACTTAVPPAAARAISVSVSMPAPSPPCTSTASRSPRTRTPSRSSPPRFAGKRGGLGRPMPRGTTHGTGAGVVAAGVRVSTRGSACEGGGGEGARAVGGGPDAPRPPPTASAPPRSPCRTRDGPRRSDAPWRSACLTGTGFPASSEPPAAPGRQQKGGDPGGTEGDGMSFERKSGRPTADAQARRAEGDMRFGPLPAAFGEDAPGTATGPGGFSTRAAGHPVDDRPHHPDDDRRLLRVILAVPVVLLTLVAAF